MRVRSRYLAFGVVPIGTLMFLFGRLFTTLEVLPFTALILLIGGFMLWLISFQILMLRHLPRYLRERLQRMDEREHYENLHRAFLRDYERNTDQTRAFIKRSSEMAQESVADLEGMKDND